MNSDTALLNAEPADKRRSELVLRATTGSNVNKGSSRPVIVQADQSVIVDGLHAFNAPLGNQIACLLDVSIRPLFCLIYPSLIMCNRRRIASLEESLGPSAEARALPANLPTVSMVSVSR